MVEKIKKDLIEGLGLGTCLGSKSAYREKNPNSHPLFNCTVMAQLEDGTLQKVWWGDLDITNSKTSDFLVSYSYQNKTNLYLYRESTVNNETFNGRRFPYEHFDACVEMRLGKYDLYLSI